MQEPHLIQREGNHLFGLHFPAEGEPRSKAVVFCNAFGKEFEICRTQVSHFCREAASSGYPSYRFDYYGFGDSDGEFEDATFSSMCLDLEAAIQELRSRARVDKVVVAGIRFGAIVAQAVAARRDDVTGLIMWAPTLKPWDYLFESLRQTVSMQTLILRDIKITRAQIVDNILAGVPSMIQGYDFNCTDEGFRLGPGLLQEVRALSPKEIAANIKVPTLVMHITKRTESIPGLMNEFAELIRANGVRCDIESALEDTVPWMHEHVFASTSPSVFQKTMSWLET